MRHIDLGDGSFARTVHPEDLFGASADPSLLFPVAPNDPAMRALRADIQSGRLRHVEPEWELGNRPRPASLGTGPGPEPTGPVPGAGTPSSNVYTPEQGGEGWCGLIIDLPPFHTEFVPPPPLPPPSYADQLFVPYPPSSARYRLPSTEAKTRGFSSISADWIVPFAVLPKTADARKLINQGVSAGMSMWVGLNGHGHQGLSSFWQAGVHCKLTTGEKISRPKFWWEVPSTHGTGATVSLAAPVVNFGDLVSVRVSLPTASYAQLLQTKGLKNFTTILGRNTKSTRRFPGCGHFILRNRTTQQYTEFYFFCGANPGVGKNVQWILERLVAHPTSRAVKVHGDLLEFGSTYFSGMSFTYRDQIVAANSQTEAPGSLAAPLDESTTRVILKRQTDSNGVTLCKPATLASDLMRVDYVYGR